MNADADILNDKGFAKGIPTPTEWEALRRREGKVKKACKITSEEKAYRQSAN